MDSETGNLIKWHIGILSAKVDKYAEENPPIATMPISNIKTISRGELIFFEAKNSFNKILNNVPGLEQCDREAALVEFTRLKDEIFEDFAAKY